MHTNLPSHTFDHRPIICRSSPHITTYLSSLADRAWAVLAWEFPGSGTNAIEEHQRAAAEEVELVEEATLAEDMPQEPEEAAQEGETDAMRCRARGFTLQCVMR